MAFEFSDKEYIKLFRKFLNWEWYTDTNTKTVFVHCLLRANWKAGDWHGIHYEPGQFITSLPSLARETGLTIQQVRTALSHLKSTGELTDLKCGRKRLITINNWDSYQGSNRLANRFSTGFQQDNQQDSNSLSTADKEHIRTLKNKEEEKKEAGGTAADLTAVSDLYNDICKSYPKLTTLSEARKKAIRARLNSGYTVDDFRRMFEIAENSDFLKGKNDRNWRATFDWMIKDANMAKILDGNYDNKSTDKPKAKPKTRFDNFPQRENDYSAAIYENIRKRYNKEEKQNDAG